MSETIDKLAKSAELKRDKLQFNLAGYVAVTMLGGAFIGFGVLLISVIGGLLDPTGVPSMKIVQGLVFGVALTMVLVGGVDLYTGNNLIMMVGLLEKRTTWLDLVRSWIASYAGNAMGSIICAAMFFAAGLASGATAEFVEKLALYKVSSPFTELFWRGVLCNILVCMGVWGFYKVQNEAAKILVIFCCIFPFITSGFEHSIANITLFSLAALIPGGEVGMQHFIHNLIPVTLGNAVGGAIFIGLAFWLSERDVQKN